MATYEQIKTAIAANDLAAAKALYEETTPVGFRDRLSGERRQEIEALLAKMEAQLPTKRRGASGRFASAS